MSAPAISSAGSGREVLARLAAKRPLAMTPRLAREHPVAAPDLDAIFARQRGLGGARTRAFATLDEVMAAIVPGTFSCRTVYQTDVAVAPGRQGA